MIQVYKTVDGICDPVGLCTVNLTFSKSLSSSTTIANCLNLLQQHCHYDVRNITLPTELIVHIWNSLPNSLLTADTINTFKIGLISFGDIRIFYIITSLIL